MLTEVKNQVKISALSIKFALMREMLNKTAFISNIVFMILNNASFIIEWLVFFSIKDNIGGYVFKDVLIIWGLSAFAFGISHFFFKKVFELSDIINNGKLDSFLVQPKNVLLSCITTDVDPSAIGDMLFGLIMLFVSGLSVFKWILYIIFAITGAIIIISVAIITGSLSFWFGRSDSFGDAINSSMINFSVYPSTIFKGVVRLVLYTIVPVGFSTFIPVNVLLHFDPLMMLIEFLVCGLLMLIAILVFNKGLKRYSSSNLMIARI